MKTKETKRVGISQKLRFEVFKRDSFKCQYCGRSAPDVLLHVDHINPVSKGGGNDLLNLTTACVECNQGKRDRLISDDSVMQKKRKQLEEMQEKQNQLQMMLEWEKELNDTTQEAVDYCVDYWEEIFNKRLSVFSNDKKMLHGLVKKYGVNSVIEAMDDATDYYYLKLNADDVYNGWREAMEKLPAICFNKKTRPHGNNAAYLRGIVERKFGTYPEKMLDNIFNKLLEVGFNFEDMMINLRGCINKKECERLIITWMRKVVEGDKANGKTN